MKYLLFSDVFIPNIGVSRDVAGHHANAFLRVEINYIDAILAEPFDAAGKIHRLADHDSADPELPDQAAAEPAGSKRGDHDFVAVGAMTPGLAERIGLAVNRRVAMLNPTIVPAAEKLAVLAEEGRADGNATFRQALPRFFNRDAQHGVVALGSWVNLLAHGITRSHLLNTQNQIVQFLQGLESLCEN